MRQSSSSGTFGEPRRTTTKMISWKTASRQYGNFLSVPQAEDYLDAKYLHLLRGLLRANTLQGVSLASMSLETILLMCTHDLTRDADSGMHLGIPHDVAGLKLRLDEDESCFTFISAWLSRNSPDGSFEANPYNTMMHCVNSAGLLDIYLTLLLFRLKLLIDIRNLRVTRKALLHTRLPGEICRLIETHAVRSPVSHQLLNDSMEDLAKKETNLLVDIRGIAWQIDLFDTDATKGLLDPDKHLRWDIDYEEPYDQRLATMFQTLYPILWELEGGIDLMDKALGLSTLADWRDVTAYPDPEMTAEDIICPCGKLELQKVQLSPGRLWRFIDYALRDATFLGPFDERPSQELMERYKPKRPKYAIVDLDRNGVVGLDSNLPCLEEVLFKWKDLVGNEALVDYVEIDFCEPIMYLIE
ncbi:hypothetical protein F5X68DRAFT_254377 [Plectosphaerella plurivora]|uniref:Uncharacterized protein n=1 Tax=Plectosphaerella plurivora TaxID=936078 RepID=A0A9P8VG33_9PEZI|nr:hypothetical protein F5X68DRAFT_254377 [Plectosphaerella plurivora]